MGFPTLGFYSKPYAQIWIKPKAEENGAPAPWVPASCFQGPGSFLLASIFLVLGTRKAQKHRHFMGISLP